MNEATARIKINKLLEEAGWRFFAEDGKSANVCLESGAIDQTSHLVVILSCICISGSIQKCLNDTPELIEILAAFPGTLDILLEALRGEQAHELAVSGFDVLQVGIFSKPLS